MIKKRINNEEDSSKKDESSSNNKKEFETYKEKCIEVLNILDKKGINIYDPNNYGGMYLKRRNSTNIPKKLTDMFEKTSKKDTEEKEEIELNNLMNFFNNNKNAK